MWRFERFAEQFADDRIVLAQAKLERMDRDEPVVLPALHHRASKRN